ncbi:hypothetical protein [Pseudoteredinibacter isoporae]|uniref:Uncharacterized protein n=1 Tax=Pseudoteredinibacter isoporae TaxID=570281 RepID=A0A7X0JTL5_9GAMM|nr:hypothetical protein [Pseudoteredinibacter isoporae]MBB6521917.1 hypothetical protein [Pseudoteredinibacter isoporae]NHO87457.1 hypothetical protein [Pseudoteredinibacter isoporae]NIB24212.1 hypothetical protein [Pseudoteredinibacter isoporae]
MSRRKEIDKEEFDLIYLYKVMRSLFSRKNDISSMEELDETVGELKKFSILTKREVRKFLKKHRKKLLLIDRESLDLRHQKLYREDLGEEEYLDSIRRQYWFGYPGLIRIAMEIEFGKAYEDFADKRDGN